MLRAYVPFEGSTSCALIPFVPAKNQQANPGPWPYKPYLEALLT